jgi:hypothetical protein
MRDWEKLAGILLDAAGDRAAEQEHPIWVRVLDSPDGDPEETLALALSAEPAGLLGWVATADCQAVGMVATGRLRPIEGAPAGAVDPADDRVRMVCLVSRAGDVAWKMGLPDGSESGETPSEGRMLDCLRRCFGLPTPPPPASPARLQAAAWLAAIFEQAQGARRPLSWSEVSRLHPVARVLDGDLHGDCSTVLPGLIRLAGSAWTWEDFRQHAQGDPAVRDVINPELAAWMDDGMFARWVLSCLPAPDELLVALRPHLTPSAARRLAHAVHVAITPEPAGAVS